MNTTEVNFESNIVRTLFQLPPLAFDKIVRGMKKVIYCEELPGFSNNHFRVMQVLRHHGSLHVNEISECTGISKPQLTSVADKLIEFGFIQRRRSSKDRRRLNIALSSHGESWLTEKNAQISKYLMERFNTLNAKETQDFLNAVKTIIRILKKL